MSASSSWRKLDSDNITPATKTPIAIEPHGLWLAYLIPELALPVVIAVAHAATGRQIARAATAIVGAVP